MNGRLGQHGGTRESARRLIRWLAVCLASVTFGPAAFGQAFVLTGGSSSMFDAHGGSLEVRTPGYTGRLDLGYFDGPGLGFSVQHVYRNVLVDAGDQQIPFWMPTDLFDRSHYFFGRGLSGLRKNGDTRLFLFAGATSTGFWAPFLNVARADSATAALFYERPLSPSLRWYSRNILARHQTSIQSLEWAARKDIRMALSAGVGSNQGYWASSFAWSKSWGSVDASYARAGDAFRRIEVVTPQLTESDRENIRAEFMPVKHLHLVASRNNYLSPSGQGLPLRAAVNGFGVWTGLSGTQLYGSLYQSSTSVGKAQAFALGARRDITRRLGAGADYLGIRAAGRSSHTLVGTVRETFSSRLGLNQVITRGNGQTTVAFGGNFISNFATVSVDYQTVFLPFAQAGAGQFKRVVVVGLHFQLPHGVQLNADTNVTPLGQVRYTGYASTYEYRGMGNTSPGTSLAGGFFQYLVRGRVVNPQGEPVEGAALRIGPQLAVTDSDGSFMVRVKKAGDLNLKVAFEEFTAQGSYVVVQAPATVKATRQESAQEYAITLRRVPNASAPEASRP